MRGSCQPGIAAVADGDHHIAQEAVAADALDGRFGEQRAETAIVEAREFGKRRLAQFAAGSIYMAQGVAPQGGKPQQLTESDG